MLFILLYREFGNVFSLTGSKTLQETLIRFIVFLRRPRCPCTEYLPSLYMQWLKGSFAGENIRLVVPRVAVATNF